MVEQTVEVENLEKSDQERLLALLDTISKYTPKGANASLFIREENNAFVGEFFLNSATMKYGLREENSSVSSLIDLLEEELISQFPKWHT